MVHIFFLKKINDTYEGLIHEQRQILWNAELKGSNHIAKNKIADIDEILPESFQIKQEDAINTLQSVCKKIWKTEQRPRDWKRSIYIPIQEKAMLRNVQVSDKQLHLPHMFMI